MKHIMTSAFFVGLLLATAVIDVRAPGTGALDSGKTVASVREELKRGDGPGHGAYCKIPGEPAVFLGRDLPDLGDYKAFTEWCLERNGEVAWKP